MDSRSIKLSEIRIDGGTQTRVSLNTDTVDDYAAEMQNGCKFPPVVVYNDGSEMWLADGFHRFHASRKCNYLDILAEVRTGTRIDAVKYALGANKANGLRRTNADKRKCVEIALKEFSGMSDRAVADLCGVHHETVAGARQKQLAETASSFPRTGLDGKTRKLPERKTSSADSRKALGVEESSTPSKSQSHHSEPITEPSTLASSERAQSSAQAGIHSRSDGLIYAELAISQLEKIHPHDSQRAEAGQKVIRWINENLI